MLDNVVATLRAGGVALLPTDTVYGLFASPEFPAAVAKIFTLKSRPVAKKLPVLAGNIGQLKSLGVQYDARLEKLLHLSWVPGPLTLILAVNQANAPPWLQGRSEVAVRLPDDLFLRSLLLTTGPLLATSANKSGQQTPPETAEILQQLAGTPDITLDNGPRSGAASTLINTRSTPYTVERRGALTDAALQEVLAL